MSRRLKILHLDPDDPESPLSAGGAIRNFQVNRILAKSHDITVLIPGCDGAPPETVREGIRYVRMGWKVANRGSSYHFTFWARLPFILNRFDCDVIVEDLMPPFSATVNPLVARKPLIGLAQWYFAHHWTRLVKFPCHRVQNRWVRWYKRLITLTPALRDEIRSRNPRADIRVIPGGVAQDHFDCTPTTGDYLLYAGRLSIADKGIDLLLHALRTVIDRRPVKLVMMGGGHEEASVKQLVSELGLTSNVHFLGKKSGAEKVAWMAGARMMIVPSRDETFGLVALEALASGKALVAFRIPPLASFCNDANSLLVEPFDVSALARTILDHWDDTDFLETLGRRARHSVQAYTWQNAARLQEAFLLEAAG